MKSVQQNVLAGFSPLAANKIHQKNQDMDDSFTFFTTEVLLPVFVLEKQMYCKL